MRVSAKERLIIKQANRLCRAIDRSFAADNYPFGMEQAREIEVFRAAADHLRWSYPVGCEYRLLEPEDRLISMFSGPLYTSEIHPWPHDKKGNPLEPICQIDLAIPSKLGDLALGDSLLQLWMEDSIFGHLRLVPKHQAQLSTLTPVPSTAIKHVWPNPRALRHFRESNSWTHGYVMSSVYEPILIVPDTLVRAFDEVPPISSKRLHLAFDALGLALKDNEIIDQSPGEIGIFGNFDTIQYSEIECPEALLIMESGSMFMWGDCGNAQIFYAPNKSGGFEFSFDWSCG